MSDTIITVPELSLVVLIGASGSGKSSFARQHFKPTEVLSSDYCRGLVSDDENDQKATNDAFEVLHYIAGKRLAAGKLTVVDATNVRPEDRQNLVQLARQHHALAAAIVLNLPREVCEERNCGRPDRQFGAHVVRHHVMALHRSLRGLKREGFSHISILNSVDEVAAAKINRVRLWNDRKDVTGPFDLIGDVHGCYDELLLLLEKLGYAVTEGETVSLTHPEGRIPVFVGDLVDRGPKTPQVLKLVMDTVAAGTAFCVVGNHDDKLKRKLQGKEVKIAHGLAESLEQLALLPPKFIPRVVKFLDGLISHYVFDGGRLVVAHAGIKAHYIGRGSGRIRDFCMYGETSGEIDSFGLPVRHDWARDYRGEALVVYGHTPVVTPEWVNNTIDIDTGCVFGGKLTALRYPERKLVAVPAAKVYMEPIRPLDHAQQLRPSDLLDLDDVTGKRIVTTELRPTVTIRAENAAAALEIMSRFAIDPHWLIYLPPTMSPCATSAEGAALEQPEAAFGYYRNAGVKEVVCQEKHMGSRAILVICRDKAVAARRFGANDGKQGVVYTRTGRSFFTDANLEAAMIERVAKAAEKAGLWDELATDWLCLDAELMPWSAKALALLEQQYAPTASAAIASLGMAAAQLRASGAEIDGVPSLLARTEARLSQANAYRAAYRRYCWPVETLEDYKLAPFHLLAHEGGFNLAHDHRWHLAMLEKLTAADLTLLRPTAHRWVTLEDPASCQSTASWWQGLTDAGGEGMVVKPAGFTVLEKGQLLQPGVKVRGREYLRLIYGPEYDAPENLVRLRKRGLGAKRSLAQREYALGHEALKRFVAGAPLYQVHEAVFGVLALESEPIDPRL